MPEQPGRAICPYCDADDTELVSLFGQQLLTAQYYCRACRTPFEFIKGDDMLPDAERHVPGADIGT